MACGQAMSPGFGDYKPDEGPEHGPLQGDEG